MIRIGIDDTDIVGSPGTNQLARAIVRDLVDRADLVRITRHQLLDDPRVPYTSQNGSASILLNPTGPLSLDEVIGACRVRMLDWFIVGSDPGLCVTDHVPPEVVAWGQRCKTDLVTKTMAHELAQRLGLHLEGLGGTEGGVIGALAAIGLAETQNDGRLVMWQLWPDDLSEEVPIETVRSREIDVVIQSSGELLTTGTVHVGKHLRPNLLRGRATLWVEPDELGGKTWKALKLK
jgi:hypothetical protein